MDDELRALATRQATICRIFANPSRVLILWSLLDGERSVGDIAGFAGASLPNTSQHLKLMKDSGLVEARREGQTVLYRLSKNGKPHGCALLIDVYCACGHCVPHESPNGGS